jgi:serine protease Do
MRFAVASVALVVTATMADGQTRATPTSAGAELSRLLETTARLVNPSVVEIFATSYTTGDGLVSRSADLVTTQRASGSGVIIDADGYIVTNAHVVRGAQRLRVEIPLAASGQSILAPRGRTVSGQVIGIDLETDLAVIKVDQRNLPALAFGDSDALSAGQIVLAFGSPLGLHNSVSLGVISAVARQLEPESPMIYVQTDASISPGSSGGPLVDVRGRVIGINTLSVSQAGGNDGLAFAAPSNIVRTVYEQIRKHGRVRRGDIGVRVQTVTPVLAAGLKLARDAGVIVADVTPDSPAARADVRPGDLVLAVDGKPMENGRQLQVTLYRRFVGEVVSLELLRAGQRVKTPVAVAERDDRLAGLSESIDPRQNLVQRLGIVGVNLDQRIAEMLPVLRVRSGVVVASTMSGAIDTREGGFAPGDVVYAVNGTPVVGVAGLRDTVAQLKSGDAVVVQLERQGQLMYLAFTIE